MKQYVGISRDHSGSMYSLAASARDDYNELTKTLQTNSRKFLIDTAVSVVECGILNKNTYHTENKFVVDTMDVNTIVPLSEYETTGRNTPLFDSVQMLIDNFKMVPDYNSPTTSFLLMICTDGGDNASNISGRQLAKTIHELEMTDKWTITFRVPTGYAHHLQGLGINQHNILEFDASSSDGWKSSTAKTTSAVDEFYVARTQGQTSTRSFYTKVDTSKLDTKTVRQELSNVSKRVKIVRVTKDENGNSIKDLITKKQGSYAIGSGYYQLTKKETISPRKQLIIWDKDSGEYYSGVEARTLLGLVSNGDLKIEPANFPQFEVFIQSTSVNRKLVGGTKVVVFQ